MFIRAYIFFVKAPRGINILETPFISNKNIPTAIKSWPASAARRANVSYPVCCANAEGVWISLEQGMTGRSCFPEKGADAPPQVVWVSKCSNRIDGTNCLIVFRSIYGSILLSFRYDHRTDGRTDLHWHASHQVDPNSTIMICSAVQHVVQQCWYSIHNISRWSYSR